jgi:hypothetical protein
MPHHEQMMKGLAMNAYKIMMRLKEGIYNKVYARKLMKSVKEEANEIAGKVIATKVIATKVIATKVPTKSIRHHYHTVQHLAQELIKEVRKTRKQR